jgi:hypothetical protein
VKQKAYRIYLRTTFPFILTLSVSFMAFLFVIAFFDTSDSSRFAFVLPTVVLFMLAYFLHKASLSWIRISEDGKEVVAVPSWYSRKLWREHRVIGLIMPGSELLFCRKSAYGAFDGYYVILRTPGGTDKVLWNAESGVRRTYWERVSQEIRELHHLHTRMVKQVVSDQGTQETSWTAQSDKLPWKNLKLIIGPAIFPWLGIVVRLITPNPWKIALVGIFFWACGVSLFWYIYRSREVARDPGLATTTLVWTLQFVGFYAATTLATNAFLHR